MEELLRELADQVADGVADLEQVAEALDTAADVIEAQRKFIRLLKANELPAVHVHPDFGKLVKCSLS